MKAGDKMHRAPELERLALVALKRFGPLTADEVAEKVGISHLNMRPRITALYQLGRVKKTGRRRRTVAGGGLANVWQIA